MRARIGANNRVFVHWKMSNSSDATTNELQQIFPNMYRGDPRQQIRQPTNPAVALERIRHGMQIPAVQGAVDPTQMHPSGLSNRSLPRGPGAIIPAPSITSATAFARRGAGRSGVGITRFLTTSVNAANSATATASGNPYVPSVSVSETSNQSTLQSPYQVQDPSIPACMMPEHRPSIPYQVPQPQFSRRTSYMPVRINRRQSSRSSRAATVPSGRPFTKTVVLVDSTDTKVPRGTRRQELHVMGAVIHLVDFSTAWNEWKVREVIETSLGGMIDDSKPHLRYTKS